MPKSSTIRNMHYTPSSYLDQKHQFEGYENMKYYNKYNDDNSNPSCNTEEKETLDAFEYKLQKNARQEERLSQVYSNLGALKRKQAYRSILKGATVVPQESLLPTDRVVGHKYYDASDPSCPISKDSFLHRENEEYKGSEFEDDEDDYGEQYKIRMLRSHRLKQVTVKTQEEIAFLEAREKKRQQALQQAKWEALQEEKERQSIAKERERLERERAAFEAMRRATLKKSLVLEEQQKERMEDKSEAETRGTQSSAWRSVNRSSIDGSPCKGCSNVFYEADDVSAAEASIFPSDIQTWIDTISDACHKVVFCGGMMDPNDDRKEGFCGTMVDPNGDDDDDTIERRKNILNNILPPEEVTMLSDMETLTDTLTAPEVDDSTIGIETHGIA